MRLTLLLSVIMMAGLFLLLYAGVGFLRDKKYFTRAEGDSGFAAGLYS